MLVFAGDLTAAASLTGEAQAVKEATGSNLAPYGALGLAAVRGDETETLALLEATKEDVTRRGEGAGITFAEWANAVLNNGLGRYPDALSAARRATSYEADLGSMIWPMRSTVSDCRQILVSVSDRPGTAGRRHCSCSARIEV